MSIVARRTEAAGLVRRARVILLSAAGKSGGGIALRLDLSAEAVSRIRRRFRDEGVEGLNERPEGGSQRPPRGGSRDGGEDRQLAMSPPPAGRSRWTTRLLGPRGRPHQRMRVGRAASMRAPAASLAHVQGES